MVSIVILLLMIVFAGILVGGLVWAVREDYKGAKQKEMPELMQKQAKEKVKHLLKIKNFIKNKDRIENKDIVELLGISEATAVCYLDELEKEGVLKQVGKTGKYTYYSKVQHLNAVEVLVRLSCDNLKIYVEI